MIELPHSDSLLGDQLFHLPAEGHHIVLRTVSALLQMIGILLFQKWFVEHGKEEYVKFYRKYAPLILIFLIFLTPYLLNATISSTVKTYVYAGKSGSDAIEIIDDKRPCTINTNQKAAECAITLQNYNHTSQKIILQLSWKQLGKTSTAPVYFIKHQKKTVFIRFPLKSAELKQLRIKPEQPLITIH